MWTTSANSALSSSIEKMTAALVHRGPDDSGTFVDGNAGVALGFRRLAIVDLSEHGHQPMRSSSGRYTIVFNGEVYNYQVLGKQLRQLGHTLRGHSDTEVILTAIEQWGVTAAVKQFVGMFAIAVWDAHQRRLWLIRDRLGIKPLFYFHKPGLLTFGSELKALTSGPAFDDSIDPDALYAYLKYLYVPAPASIFTHVRKLEPGCILAIDDVARPLPSPERYWDLNEIARSGINARADLDERAAVDQLDELLKEAVTIRMHADVPLGALLSGGIDSSTVVALMQESSPRPVRTFTIGFDAREHDESEHAALIAKHLGTQHTSIRVGGEEALNVVPMLPRMFDEPLADPSQIPTYLVSALARRDVTVALSGDGGDEVFTGYHRYLDGERLIPRLSKIPPAARRLAAAAMGAVPNAAWEGASKAVTHVLPHRPPIRLAGEKARKAAKLMRWNAESEMYESLLSVWQSPQELLADGRARTTAVTRALRSAQDLTLLDRMALADQQVYLPDDLLAKVDRASMAVALEVRVPLIDHRVVEFAWRTPRQLRIRDGRGKWLLRQVLYRRVPRELVDRPKVGFTVPIAEWLRGPLRSWAADTFASSAVRSGGVLNATAVNANWQRFLNGDDAVALGLWTILVYCDWRASLA